MDGRICHRHLNKAEHVFWKKSTPAIQLTNHIDRMVFYFSQNAMGIVQMLKTRSLNSIPLPGYSTFSEK